MKSSLKTSLIFLATLSPWALFADTDVAGIMNSIKTILVSNVITFIFALAMIYFLAGVIKYIGAGGDSKKASEGRSMMIYGLIALFVMVSVDGLVTILLKTFGWGYTLPQLKTG